MNMRNLAGDIRRDISLAFRQMRRRPLTAVVTIVIIAFSVGATAAVFAVADAALLRPLPFPDGDRLVFITDTQGEDAGLPASLPEVRDWQEKSTAFSSFAAFYGASMVYDGGSGAELIPGAGVWGDPAATLRIVPLEGRWFTREEQHSGARVVLLGEDFWREKLGAARSVVGQTIRLDNQPFTVIGIAPRETGIIRAGRMPAIWTPMLEKPSMERGLHFMSVVARLRDGTTLEQANVALQRIAAGLKATGVTEHGIGVQSARDLIVGDATKTLKILGASTLILLLIACANLASLFLSRSIEQTREFAVRAALGARAHRLARQTLVETVIIALIGGAFGLVFAHNAIGLIATLAHRAGNLAPVRTLDPRLVGLTLSLSLFVGLLFGMWPTVRASQNDPATFLRGTGRASAGKGTLLGRRALVTVELALALILLSAAALLVRSMSIVLHENPGFRADHVATFNVALRGDRFKDDAAQVQIAEQLRQQLAKLPGVVAAGIGTNLPLDGSDTNGTFEIVGRAADPANAPASKKRAVSPGYFDALRIKVKSGRDFSANDRAGAPDVVIITEALARKYWPNENALGKRVRFGWGPGDEETIVGIVDDVRSDALDVPVEQGTIYRPAAQFPMRNISVAVRTTDDPAVHVAQIRGAVRQLDASVPVSNVQSLSDLVAASTANRRTLMLLLSGLALIALLISSVGVYAITMQAVSRRTSELGIRLALGAGTRDVLGLVLGAELKTVVAGLAIGTAGSLAASKILASSLYGVAPNDPTILAAVAATLATFALIAAFVPARRVTKIAPTAALRDINN